MPKHKSRKRKPSLPMVRLNLVTPLTTELARRRIDPGGVLDAFTVNPEDLLDPGVFVPAPKMYALVEALSEASGDPHFGVRAGEHLDPWQWPPMQDAARRSATVGEFLLRFMAGAERDSNSAVFELKTSRGRSHMKLQRTMDGGIVPRHNDGFTLAYLLSILHGALDTGWVGSKVIARCCDPRVIPTGYLGIRVARTDTLGPGIEFPGDWLIRDVAVGSPEASAAGLSISAAPADTIVEAFSQALRPHLHEPRLDMDRIAAICGFSKRTLARRLQSRGTTAQNEIRKLRQATAERDLRTTSLPVGQIGARVGYPDPAVFSRTFRRWTGLSPRQFRNAKVRDPGDQR